VKERPQNNESSFDEKQVLTNFLMKSAGKMTSRKASTAKKN
jgi:hypothetical protein